jgi:copper transport protein
MNRSILLLCAALVLAALLPGSASAHANYVSSNPAPDSIFPYNSTPAAVSVTLSEAIESGRGTIDVTNGTGARFDVAPVTFSADSRTMTVAMKPTGAGVFTVAWTAASAIDGHYTAGSFAFGVQDRNGSLPGGIGLGGATSTGAPVSPFEVGLRFIGFLGLAAALGASVLGAFMWIAAGRDPDVKETPTYRLGFQVVTNVARAGAFAFALAFAGLFLLTDALETGVGVGSVVGSTYKVAIVLSLAVGVVLFIVLSSAFTRSRNQLPEEARRHLLVAVVLGFAAIAIGSAGTHAAASETLPLVGIVADAAHVSGVTLWVGGLVTIFGVRSFLREPTSVPLARIVFGRFSGMAFYCVGLVLLGGLVLAILLVGSVDALFRFGYGWVVLAKVALFAPMIAFGAYNRYRLLPRAAETGEPVAAFRQLTWNVRNETALGATVLILAALLASLTPAVSVVAGPQQFTIDNTVSGIRVHLLVSPTPTIANISYTLQFFLYYASNGSTYNFGKNTSDITFKSETNVSLPPETRPLDGPHGGYHFLITTLAMSQPGTWRIDARFARSDGFDLIVTFHIVLTRGS